MGFLFNSILAWFETFITGVLAQLLSQLVGGGA
jgi:hypothetical protein